jgi:hypothetical protein
MKCDCGRYLTQQSKVVAKMYEADETLCIVCLSESLNVPYQELIDRYMGIYECRPCAKDKQKAELRRKLLGG